MENIKFELSKEQTKKYLDWKKSLPKLPENYFGVNGGRIYLHDHTNKYR
jgi:hypothetical protein